MYPIEEGGKIRVAPELGTRRSPQTLFISQLIPQVAIDQRLQFCDLRIV